MGVSFVSQAVAAVLGSKTWTLQPKPQTGAYTPPQDLPVWAQIIAEWRYPQLIEFDR